MAATTSLLAAYLRLTYATLRWTRENQTAALAVEVAASALGATIL